MLGKVLFIVATSPTSTICHGKFIIYNKNIIYAKTKYVFIINCVLKE